MKTKTIKKISLLLGAVVAAGVLASCGGSGNDAGIGTSNVDVSKLGDVNGLKLPIGNGKTEISVLVDSTVADLDNKFFLKNLEGITGLDIKPILVAPSNAAQKLQMLAASKQLPDLSRNYLQASVFDDLAVNGALANISENLDKMPNFKKLFKDTPENSRVFDELASSDGNLYIIPSYGIARKVNHTFMYRKDIFDSLGIEPWTDTESFYNALKKLKEAYPDSIPFTSKQQFNLIMYLANQWGMDLNLDRYYNKETSQWEYAGTSERMRDMLDFLRKLYAEKLFDPEFLTNTSDSWTAKMTNENKSFVTFDWVDRMDMFYAQTVGTIPEYDLQPGYPIGAEGKYTPMDPVGSSQLFVANNKKVDYTLALADFLLSEAGARLSTVGVEGETYNYVDGKVKYIGFEDSKELNINDLEEKYGLFTLGLSNRYDPECVYFQYTPRTQAAQDLVTENDLVQPIYPKMMTRNDTDRYSELYTNLLKEFEVFASKYIFGVEDADVEWNNWLEKAKSLNVDEFVEILRRNSEGQTR